MLVCCCMQNVGAAPPHPRVVRGKRHRDTGSGKLVECRDASPPRRALALEIPVLAGKIGHYVTLGAAERREPEGLLCFGQT